MSVIRKKPYIETQLEKLTEEQLVSLKTVIDTISTGETYYSLIDNDDSLNTYLAEKETEIKAIKLRLDKEHIRNGILIYNDAEQIYPMCIFITYHAYQDLATYEIDLIHGKAKEIREYLDINELRRIVDVLSIEATGGASAWERAIKEYVIQNENTTEVGGNMEIDGELAVNTHLSVFSGDERIIDVNTTNKTSSFYEHVKIGSAETPSDLQVNGEINVGDPDTVASTTLLNIHGDAQIHGEMILDNLQHLQDPNGYPFIPDNMGHAGEFLKAGTTGLVWDTPFVNNNKVIAVSEADWETYTPLVGIVYVVYNTTTHQCTTYFYTE